MTAGADLGAGLGVLSVRTTIAGADLGAGLGLLLSEIGIELHVVEWLSGNPGWRAFDAFSGCLAWNCVT